MNACPRPLRLAIIPYQKRLNNIQCYRNCMKKNVKHKGNGCLNRELHDWMPPKIYMVYFFLDSFAQVKFPSSFSREDGHDHGESMKNILSSSFYEHKKLPFSWSFCIEIDTLET